MVLVSWTGNGASEIFPKEIIHQSYVHFFCMLRVATFYCIFLELYGLVYGQGVYTLAYCLGMLLMIQVQSDTTSLRFFPNP